MGLKQHLSESNAERRPIGKCGVAQLLAGLDDTELDDDGMTNKQVYDEWAAEYVPGAMRRDRASQDDMAHALSKELGARITRQALGRHITSRCTCYR